MFISRQFDLIKDLLKCDNIKIKLINKLIRRRKEIHED